MSGAGRAGDFGQRGFAEKSSEVRTLSQTRHGRLREGVSQFWIVRQHGAVMLLQNIANFWKKRVEVKYCLHSFLSSRIDISDFLLKSKFSFLRVCVSR